jgi:hypothetical protein
MNFKIIAFIFGCVILTASCKKDEINTPAMSNTSTKNIIKLDTAPAIPKAYIFIEPTSKYSMVSQYLRDSTIKSPLFPRPFLGFNGVDGGAIQYNFLNYVDMPHWYDGRLPAIIEAEIPQQSGGLDAYGNAKSQYIFTTVKIPKNTTIGTAWVSIFIPVKAMGNDAKRLRAVYTYEKLGNTLVTNGSVSGFTRNLDQVISGYTYTYKGTRIPKGTYRLYGTYPSSGLRAILTETKDFYMVGNALL